MVDECMTFYEYIYLDKIKTRSVFTAVFVVTLTYIFNFPKIKSYNRMIPNVFIII